jgi:UDP-sugar pyrophosphorylase
MQVRGLERGYPGGVAAYLKNAKALLKSSAAGENPFEGMKPEVPHGVSLDYGTPQFVELEEKGVSVFRDCAFVLVAGGLGERLGYSGIKVELPVETVTNRCYLQLYCQQILAMQEYSNKLAGAAPGSRICPLVIMTSDDTHSKTVRLLESNHYFGMAPGQVTILKQEKVAALVDNDAHIASAENGNPYEIDTKPHGHGDVHTLLSSSGLAQKWSDEGRKYVIFFQDTNSLAFTVTQAAIGVSITQGFEVNSIAVPRKAKDAVGAITKLVKGDGSSITVSQHQSYTCSCAS